jgi:hypothetical protein
MSGIEVRQRIDYLNSAGQKPGIMDGLRNNSIPIGVGVLGLMMLGNQSTRSVGLACLVGSTGYLVYEQTRPLTNREIGIQTARDWQSTHAGYSQTIARALANSDGSPGSYDRQLEIETKRDSDLMNAAARARAASRPGEYQTILREITDEFNRGQFRGY